MNSPGVTIELNRSILLKCVKLEVGGVLTLENLITEGQNINKT